MTALMTRDEWAATFADDGTTTLDFEVEKELCAWGVISPCDLEFGPHDDHDDCTEAMAEMRDDGMELGVDYLFKNGSPTDPDNIGLFQTRQVN